VEGPGGLHGELLRALPRDRRHQRGRRDGPNLTHVASRLSLAAGTLPNTRGHLAGWIVDPQLQKPGNNMPPNLLGPDELHALLSYLETLR
jgi:cytochrome c oxidase subunit 2